MNAPNLLTLLRILLVPVLVAALLSEGPERAADWFAAGIFCAASATDALDGYLARRNRSITTFGKLMDPLADKLLVTAALVSLVSLDRLSTWVAMVIIAREFAVTGLRALAAEQGLVVAATVWGKVKTAMQIAMVVLLITITGDPAWLDVVVGATVLVTIASGADYFFGLRRVLADGDAPPGVQS